MSYYISYGGDNFCLICYIYNAEGQKLASVVDGSFTYYRNTLVYEDDSALPTKIFHPEGFVALNVMQDEFQYKYFKRDHLGSVRALLAENNGVLVEEQKTDFYPFGEVHGQYENLHLNRYLFSGKELQDATVGTAGLLGWYDFGARHYDPVLGHWMASDLLKQFANPYLYCANSPANFVDPNGLYGSEPPVDKNGGMMEDVIIYDKPSPWHWDQDWDWSFYNGLVIGEFMRRLSYGVEGSGIGKIRKIVDEKLPLPTIDLTNRGSQNQLDWDAVNGNIKIQIVKSAAGMGGTLATTASLFNRPLTLGPKYKIINNGGTIVKNTNRIYTSTGKIATNIGNVFLGVSVGADVMTYAIGGQSGGKLIGNLAINFALYRIGLSSPQTAIVLGMGLMIFAPPPYVNFGEGGPMIIQADNTQNMKYYPIY